MNTMKKKEIKKRRKEKMKSRSKGDNERRKP